MVFVKKNLKLQVVSLYLQYVALILGNIVRAIINYFSNLKKDLTYLCFLVYIEFDDPDDKSVKLEFKDMVEDFESKWDIRASQIQCSALYK